MFTFLYTKLFHYTLMISHTPSWTPSILLITHSFLGAIFPLIAVFLVCSTILGNYYHAMLRRYTGTADPDCVTSMLFPLDTGSLMMTLSHVACRMSHVAFSLHLSVHPYLLRLFWVNATAVLRFFCLPQQ